MHEVAQSFGLLGLWPTRPDFLDREYETGRLVVGGVGDRVVGFAGAFRRGDLTHLGDLFVLRAYQSHGVGRALLDAVLAGESPVVTFASADPRAVALYIRHGMHPQGMMLALTGIPRLDGPHATVRETSVEEVADLDGAASGGSRQPDLTWYGHLPGVRVHATDRGYAFVRPVGDDLFIGPAGGATPRDCADTVTATIARSGHQGRVCITVPGIHPLLPLLIRAGLRIVDTDTYMASQHNLVDLTRYIPHGDLG